MLSAFLLLIGTQSRLTPRRELIRIGYARDAAPRDGGALCTCRVPDCRNK